jgi:hypothetical protein
MKCACVSRSAFGSLPLCSLVLAGAKPWGSVRRHATAAVGAFGADCAAVLGFRSRRKTRFTRCARYAQTIAASQSTKRAITRAARNPPRLAAAQARRRTLPHGFTRQRPFFVGERSQSGHRARLAPSERAFGARQVAGSMPSPCLSSFPLNDTSCKAWGRPGPGCVGDGEYRSEPRTAGRRIRRPALAGPKPCLHVPLASPVRFMHHGSRQARWSH